MRYLIAAAACLTVLPQSASAQNNGAPSAADKDRMIANAMSAAPASLSSKAKVMLMDGTVLREGTNGWTCIPDDPAEPNNAPVCLDDTWLAFFDAYMNKKQPKVERMGIAYMLQSDMPVSNTDPYATAPTPDNQWLQVGVPHLMIVMPTGQSLDGVSSDPHNGGPWVMWKGTPYAHIMVPSEPRMK